MLPAYRRLHPGDKGLNKKHGRIIYFNSSSSSQYSRFETDFRLEHRTILLIWSTELIDMEYKTYRYGVQNL